MLVDYKDRVTGEVFEVYYKTRLEIPEATVNEKTGNLADKQFSSGTFRFAGANFNNGSY